MTFVTGPKVFLVAQTSVDYDEMGRYLKEVDGQEWLDQVAAGEHPGGEGEDLVEFAGRLCYRSWKPGLNPNVTKVRTDHGDYLANLLKSRHGSVLEHVTYSFVFHNVSRVFTHELVTHRVGIAKSQESLRYVRLDKVPLWVPGWARSDEEVMDRVNNVLLGVEQLQAMLAEHYDLDKLPFSAKKRYTSFMRRFVPMGVATTILWTANARTLRHCIEVRTAEGAEEEMRLVFGNVAKLLTGRDPALFGDFKAKDGVWTPEYSKV